MATKEDIVDEKTAGIDSTIEHVDFANENDILREFRQKAEENREFGDEVVTPETNIKLRLRVLSHDDMVDAQKRSGTTLTSSQAMSYSLMFEIMVRAITHFQGQPIENITKAVKMPQKSLAQKLAAQEHAREQMRPYYKMFTEDEVVHIVTEYLDMVERRNAAIFKLKETPKKK